MRVLFLQQGLGYGGASQSLIQMQRALTGKVEMYTVLKKNRRLNKKLMHLLCHSKVVVEMDIPGVYSYPEGISTLEELNRAQHFNPTELLSFIQKNKIDILHVNASVFSNLYHWLKRESNVKIVTHIREAIPESKDTVTSFIVNQINAYSDWIIPIANEEAVHFSNSDKCTILINPVDTHFFSRVPRVENSTIVIGMMANFNPLKGHKLFIEVVRELNKKYAGNKKVRFELLGIPASGFLNFKCWLPLKRFAYFQEVMREIKRSNFTNLTLIPFQENVKDVIARWDIALRMERSMKPWGRDVLETMSMGIPMVALGNSEVVIKNNVTGKLVNSLQSAEVIEALIPLIDDDKSRKDMGVEGRIWMQENAGIDRYSERILGIYKNIMR